MQIMLCFLFFDTFFSFVTSSSGVIGWRSGSGELAASGSEGWTARGRLEVMPANGLCTRASGVGPVMRVRVARHRTSSASLCRPVAVPFFNARSIRFSNDRKMTVLRKHIATA